MNTFTTSSVIAFLGFLAAATPHLQAGPTPKEQLDGLAQRREAIKSLHTNSRIEIREPHASRQIVLDRYEQAGDPRRYRIETKVTSIVSPDASGRSEHRSLVIFDGKNEWTQMDAGDAPLVLKGAASQTDPYVELRGFLAFQDVRVEEEKLGHEPCLRFIAKGKMDDEEVQASFWIAMKHGVIMKSEVTYADRLASTMTTQKISTDRQRDDRFEYEVPKEAAVIPVEKLQSSPGATDSPKQAEP